MIKCQSSNLKLQFDGVSDSCYLWPAKHQYPTLFKLCGSSVVLSKYVKYKPCVYKYNFQLGKHFKVTVISLFYDIRFKINMINHDYVL